MTIPDKVLTLGGPITVIESQPSELDTEQEIVYADWDPPIRLIRVRSGMAAAEVKKALWHEWAHAIFHDTGVTDYLGDIEEMVCKALALNLAALGVELPTTPADDGPRPAHAPPSPGSYVTSAEAKDPHRRRSRCSGA